MYQLICMAFDGEYQTEKPKFESIDDAWEYSNDLGSKWYFYPFHFVIENATIKDTPFNLEFFKGKLIAKVVKDFNQLSKKDEMKNSDPDDFMMGLITYHHNL